jgi:short-subunit dehydrogenase
MHKIAITGHMHGIGKAIYDRLSKKYETIGFDIENGFDITMPESIIQKSNDCEVFINNAYVDEYQNKIAEAWYQHHINDRYFLISISSIAGDMQFYSDDILFMKEYSQNKKILNQLSRDINYSGNKCRSAVVLPGFVKTNFFSPTIFPEDSDIGNFYKEVEKTNSFILPEDVAIVVEQMIESFNNHFFISHMTIINRL